MNKLLIGVWTLILSLATNYQANCQVNNIKALGSVDVKAGSSILINNPSIRPYSGIPKYQSVFTKVYKLHGVNGSLSGDNPLVGIVDGFIDYKGYYLTRVDLGDNNKLYINLNEALINHEVDLIPSPIISKFSLYATYLSQLEKVTLQTQKDYLYTFKRMPKGLDEFDKQAWFESADKEISNIIKTPKTKEGKVIAAKCIVDNYDFNKNAFIVKEMPDYLSYSVSLENDVYELGLILEKFDGKPLVKIPKEKAEKIVKENWKSDFSERVFYCIYHFDLTTSDYLKQKYTGKQAYVQYAKLTSIEFYTDTEFTNLVHTLTF